jgi:hypothetical protein
VNFVSDCQFYVAKNYNAAFLALVTYHFSAVCAWRVGLMQNLHRAIAQVMADLTKGNAALADFE